MNDLLTSPAATFFFAITVVTTLYDFATNYSVRNQFILNPYLVYHKKDWKRIFTHSLIHADLMHFGFNMLTYFFVAFTLEHIIGHWQFAVVYIFSLIISSLPDVIKYRNVPSYNSLGASGAISGILFSTILFVPTSTIYLFGMIPMPAWLFAILYLAYSYYSAKRGMDNIGHTAHMYGALAGLAITLILEPWLFMYYLAFLGIGF